MSRRLRTQKFWCSQLQISMPRHRCAHSCQQLTRAHAHTSRSANQGTHARSRPQISILERLPTNASGKVLKTSLREMLLAAQPPRLHPPSLPPQQLQPQPWLPQQISPASGVHQIQRRFTPIRAAPPLPSVPVTPQDMARHVLAAMPHLSLAQVRSTSMPHTSAAHNVLAVLTNLSEALNLAE